MAIEHYVKLIVANKLDPDRAKTFYTNIKEIVDPILEKHDDNKIITLTKDNNDYIYCIYLTRCLNTEEINAVNTALKANFSEGKLKVSIFGQEESTETENIAVIGFKTPTNNPITIVKQLTPVQEIDCCPQVCEEVAKYIHNRWLNNKLKNGWKYGMQLDMVNKVHPLMMPFERLPDQYKDVDINFGSFLKTVLNSFGYQITKK